MTTPPVCSYEGSDYQTSFWEQGGRAYEDAAEAIALRRLLPEGGARLLELGAGAGRNTPRYAGFEQVVLVDYSVTQLQQARQRLGDEGRYRYVAANIYHLPFVPGLFDAATMIRTLHHMADAPAALRQVRRTLQPGAHFVLEFANKRNVKSILRWLARRQDWNPFSPEPIEFAALNFDFHPRQVRQWLAAEGFNVRRLLTVSHLRVGVLKRLLPVRLLAALDGLLQPTGKWVQLSPSVFAGCQAEGDVPTAAEAGDFFACPSCNAPLADTPPELRCRACGKVWRVSEGIYDFRVD
ncbi:MAG: methyltransferase domain-containing protein [Anaerolineae bacterium]|nr:methyltransferase domain-containing protein [Anaerolineae bacterium]